MGLPSFTINEYIIKEYQYKMMEERAEDMIREALGALHKPKGMTKNTLWSS
jgi:DNA-binding phage protein